MSRLPASSATIAVAMMVNSQDRRQLACDGIIFCPARNLRVQNRDVFVQRPDDRDQNLEDRRLGLFLVRA
jgi:hypothetical protein